MEVTALCSRLLMLEFILLGTRVQNNYAHGHDAVVLRISPNTLQHFDYEHVSFTCEGSDTSTTLRVTKDAGESSPVCTNKTLSSGFSCTIDRAYPADSGQYWCETKGERSNTVNITVTAESVILESPALVFEGDDVTLRCRTETPSTDQTFKFFKDDVVIQSSAADEKSVKNVSKSDEGLYKCSSSAAGTSPGIWLAVRASVAYITSPPLHEAPLYRDSEGPNVLILLWVTVTIFMLILVLLLVGFLHIRKHRVYSKTQKTESHSDEDRSMSDGEADAADLGGLTYAVVFRKEKKNKDTGDNLSRCVKTNQSRKPQVEIGEDESPHQPVYASIIIRTNSKRARLSSFERTHNPKADENPGLPEQEVLYSPIQKAKKNRAK